MPTFAEFAALKYSAGGQPVTRHFSQRLGAVIAWVAQGIGATPNQLTLLGAAMFVAAATLFATLPANAVSVLACVILFQLAYGVDCADGQLARSSGRTSAYGAWLDVACDYFRNVALGAGVAAWLARSGVPAHAAIAVAALFVAGAAVQLHTVTVLRQADPNARMQTSGAASALRGVLTTFFDSATVLLFLALLRPWPVVLAGYLSLLGIVLFAVAAFQAGRRLRQA